MRYIHVCTMYINVTRINSKMFINIHRTHIAHFELPPTHKPALCIIRYAQHIHTHNSKCVKVYSYALWLIEFRKRIVCVVYPTDVTLYMVR